MMASATVADAAGAFLPSASGSSPNLQVRNRFAAYEAVAADPETGPPRYRAWLEGYTVRSKSAATGEFAGDRRRTYGSVAGIGMIVAPNVAVSLSVDHSRTRIEAPSQIAHVDLTQLGAGTIFQSGPWTASAALVRGFASIDSARNPATDVSVAAYRGGVWSALADLGYNLALGGAIVVAKVGVDWLRTQTDPYTETGGTDPVSAPAVAIWRARVFAGAEVGRYWLLDNTWVGVSAYGRVVDVVAQRAADYEVLSALGAAPPQLVSGQVGPKLGYDTGGMIAVQLSPRSRLYATYDGRFRRGFEAHGGSVGIDFRW